MFIGTAKGVIVKALELAFTDGDYPDKPVPHKVSQEYQMEKESWPFIYVQLHVNSVSWMGIDPDIDTMTDPPDADAPWTRIRPAVWDGFVDLTVLSTSSIARDSLWDAVIKLALMGRLHPTMKRFYEFIEGNYEIPQPGGDPVKNRYVPMTVIEGKPQPVGDATGVGTPWEEEIPWYEATVRLRVVGQFYADELGQTLQALDDVEVLMYTQVEVDESAIPGDDRPGLVWRET
jgi:hypothetical protein